MGSYASKFLALNGDGASDSKIKQESSSDPSPRTPVDRRHAVPIDPRSASVGIPRTPIEVVNYLPSKTVKRAVSAIPQRLRDKPYLETDLDDVIMGASVVGTCESRAADYGTPRSSSTSYLTVPNTPEDKIPQILFEERSPLTFPNHAPGDTPTEELRYKILGIDPRSPAADFDRTPILTTKSMIKWKARSQEHLHRRGSYSETDVSYSTSLAYCETVNATIPEIQALPDILSNVNRTCSLNALTENSGSFDSPSSSSGSSSSAEAISNSSDQITVIRNINAFPVSSVAETFLNSDNALIAEDDEVPSPASTTRKTSRDLANDVDRVLSMAAKALTTQQSSPNVEASITVWRDSISPQCCDSLVLENDDIAPSTINEKPASDQEVMIEFDDVQVMRIVNAQTGLKKENKTDDAAKKTESSDKKKKTAKAEKGIIIDNKIFVSDGKNLGQPAKIRTPLGNRSNNHGKSSNMPMKSPQQLLRTKVMTAKLHQENTPPRTTKSNLNGTQWDPDLTVMI